MQLLMLRVLECWHKIPTVRGSVRELYNINKVTKDFVGRMGVQIRNKSVDLKHKFVLVPLVYNKDTCDLDFIEMEME